MLKPRLRCEVIQTSGKTDEYGRQVIGKKFQERCAIIKLGSENVKTAVRVDSSASRGNAHEFITNAVILMQANTKAELDDIVIVLGHKIKVTGKYARVDINGRLDHWQVEGMIWSGKT